MKVALVIFDSYSWLLNIPVLSELDLVWALWSNAPSKHCRFWRYIDCLCACLPYHLLLFHICNLLP